MTWAKKLQWNYWKFVVTNSWVVGLKVQLLLWTWVTYHRWHHVWLELGRENWFYLFVCFFFFNILGKILCPMYVLWWDICWGLRNKLSAPSLKSKCTNVKGRCDFYPVSYDTRSTAIIICALMGHLLTVEEKIKCTFSQK